METGRMGRLELITTLGKLCEENKTLNEQVTAIQQVSTKLKEENQALKTPKKTIEEIAADAAIWSQLTFGSDEVRGPIGPLKHLEKEAKEVQEKPDDLVEYADCLLLVLDSARRAGFSLRQLLDATDAKLQINKKRVWPKPQPGQEKEAIEHNREANDHERLILEAHGQ
jgi:hypothetical protein